jgi:DNA-binding IclR family transcriptional regulator
MARGPAVTASARFVFAVLRLAAVADAPLSVTEISRRLGVPVNKAYRAAVTLESAGYLRRHAHTGRFEIGSVAEQLVYAVFQQFNIRGAIAPYLRLIATTAEATTSLAVRIGWYAVTLALAESRSNIVSRAPRLGRATLLDSDAGGLAILAWLTPDEVRQFFSFAANHPSQVSLAVPNHKKRLAAFKRAGFATGVANNKQLQALAIPLCDTNGRPVASITVEAPVSRALALEADPLLKDWRDIAAQAEVVVRANPETFANPYAFLDPDAVEFSDR